MKANSENEKEPHGVPALEHPLTSLTGLLTALKIQGRLNTPIRTDQLLPEEFVALARARRWLGSKPFTPPIQLGRGRDYINQWADQEGADAVDHLLGGGIIVAARTNSKNGLLSYRCPRCRHRFPTSESLTATPCPECRNRPTLVPLTADLVGDLTGGEGQTTRPDHARNDKAGEDLRRALDALFDMGFERDSRAVTLLDKHPELLSCVVESLSNPEDSVRWDTARVPDRLLKELVFLHAFRVVQRTNSQTLYRADNNGASNLLRLHRNIVMIHEEHIHHGLQPLELRAMATMIRTHAQGRLKLAPEDRIAADAKFLASLGDSGAQNIWQIFGTCLLSFAKLDHQYVHRRRQDVLAKMLDEHERTAMVSAAAAEVSHRAHRRRAKSPENSGLMG